MNKLKNWLIARRNTIIIALVVLVGVYYMYLTQVYRLFQISETYYVSDEYSAAIMEFEGDTLSVYLINPSSDIIATRTDYRVGYRKYNKDIIGNFWSDDGIEPFALRGSDVAGRLYAECIGSTIWPVDGEMTYFDQDDILYLEEANDTSYSFGSRFSLKDGTLRVFNYIDLDFQQTDSIPEVDAEIIRLLDSLCPPEF